MGFDGLLKGVAWCLGRLHVRARENSSGAIIEVRWLKGGWMLLVRVKVGFWGLCWIRQTPCG